MRLKRIIGNGTAWLGYHAGDVEETMKLVAESRQEVEKILMEEREVYITEFASKTNEIVELRALLEKVQAEERAIIGGGTPK
ncbi:hypothetical protein PMSD_09085 [Paenibacillus macquariensis subsp. defensor]|nr:hypothetical protein PMSD_09085 [Paenibacillus macquariensis subsp. defensor]